MPTARINGSQLGGGTLSTYSTNQSALDAAQWYFDRQQQLLLSEYDRWALSQNIRSDYTTWQSNDGRKIKLSDLDDNHLRNIINKINRESWRVDWLPHLMAEYDRRTAKPKRVKGFKKWSTGVKS